MSLSRAITVLTGCLIIGAWPLTSVWATPIQPFDAVVQVAPGEEAFVRSGPGQSRYYPTMKLPAGAKVHVLRKDLGGWYMINPPEGSYSWVIAKYVQQSGAQGTITENGVVVRVGAFNSTQRDVEQVRLNKGDTVEILGEDVLDSGKGKEKWLRIKPPRNEYRWIKGSHLVELNPDGSPKVVAKNTAKKPVTPPETGEQSPAVAVPTTPRTKPKEPAVARHEGGDAPLFGPPGRKPEGDDPFAQLDEEPPQNKSQEETIREDLSLLDQELRQILSGPATQWDLRNQFTDLQSLKEMAGNTPLAAEITQRLALVQRYQQVHEDSLYMAQRMRPDQPANSRLLGTTQRPLTDPSQVNRQTPPSSNAASQRFQGAGIVVRLEKAPANQPAWVIAAPDGRILCYLDPEPGINLNPYNGQAMGLNGVRTYDRNLKADRMRVQKLTPIRLAR